jgi:hypothetical protein
MGYLVEWIIAWNLAGDLVDKRDRTKARPMTREDYKRTFWWLAVLFALTLVPGIVGMFQP